MKYVRLLRRRAIFVKCAKIILCILIPFVLYFFFNFDRGFHFNTNSNSRIYPKKLTNIDFDSINFKKYKYANSNKIYADIEIEKAALIALSFFPELSESHISFEFVSDEDGIAHSAQPDPKSALNKNRSYRVMIVDKTQDSSLLPTTFRYLSDDAKVGIIGHELAHILDYSDDNNLWLLYKGLVYIADEKFKIDYEKKTNLTVVKHNLGNQLLSWTNEVHKSLRQMNRGHRYHSPKELEFIIKEFQEANETR